jgi:folate-dependent phosphoribosylglycinamide formyltransferase PurN
LDHQHPNLVLLGSDNPTTWIVYNRLVQEFGPFPAIIESHTSRWGLFRRRVRKLGLFVALGQVVFVVLIRPLLNYSSRRRINQICRLNGLERAAPLSTFVTQIVSANGEECANFLRRAKADIVIVNGARILRPHILKSTPALFINTHQGITPKFRGAHGGYWALQQNDRSNCGVTVHLIDEGIDTGAVIEQARIVPTADDNYATYPYLQTAAALPLLSAAIHDVMKDTLKTTVNQGPSRVWYHPGFLTYVLGRWRGVK